LLSVGIELQTRLTLCLGCAAHNPHQKVPLDDAGTKSEDCNNAAPTTVLPKVMPLCGGLTPQTASYFDLDSRMWLDHGKFRPYP
jgi:hypothetical protein